MEKLISLFNEYRLSGKDNEAMITGQNLIMRFGTSKEALNAYFDFVYLLAERSTKFFECKFYYEKAAFALSQFSENADLDKDTVEYIVSLENRLARISEQIHKLEKQEVQDKLNKINQDNDKAIDLASRLTEKLRTCKNVMEVNKTLGQIEAVDAEIDKENLNNSQKEKYNELSGKCASIAQRKLREFDSENKKTYNIRAVETYEKVFNWFKSGNIPNNHESAMREFFSYDASKLFNETLVYYNHVYSFVLSTLSDEDKLKMTKIAIMCERKQ